MDRANALYLSNALLDCVVNTNDRTSARLGRPNAAPWVNGSGTSPLFAVRADGRLLDATSDELRLEDVSVESFDDGGQRAVMRFRDTSGLLTIDHYMVRYPDTALVEQWQTVQVTGDSTVRIDRLDSVRFDLAAGSSELLSFTGSWGLEFEPHRVALAGEIVLESRSGRSSNGMHPWFALTREDGEIVSGAVMWSGNWVVRFEPSANGALLSCGLHDWEFATDLAPGESIESPHVVLALGGNNDLNTVSHQYARVGRRYWYARNDLAESLPTEWNHWWSYEDSLINEGVMRSNVAVAAGVTVICQVPYIEQ